MNLSGNSVIADVVSWDGVIQEERLAVISAELGSRSRSQGTRSRAPGPGSQVGGVEPSSEVTNHPNTVTWDSRPPGREAGISVVSATPFAVLALTAAPGR